MTNEYAYPSWITDPVSIPGQLSLLDLDPEPEEDETPPHGIPRPVPLTPEGLDWAIEVQLHTTEELVAWGSQQLVESDADSDLVDAIRLELDRRGVRLFGRWTR